MTERYAHLAPERLRGAVARLEGPEMSCPSVLVRPLSTSRAEGLAKTKAKCLKDGAPGGLELTTFGRRPTLHPTELRARVGDGRVSRYLIARFRLVPATVCGTRSTLRHASGLRLSVGQRQSTGFQAIQITL